MVGLGRRRRAKKSISQYLGLSYATAFPANLTAYRNASLPKNGGFHSSVPTETPKLRNIDRPYGSTQ
eukprot:4306856-Prymnesium_polylepis.1